MYFNEDICIVFCFIYFFCKKKSCSTLIKSADFELARIKCFSFCLHCSCVEEDKTLSLSLSLIWRFNHFHSLNRLPLVSNILPPPWPCNTLTQPTASSWESYGHRSDQPCCRRGSMELCSITSRTMIFWLNSNLGDAEILLLMPKWRVSLSTQCRWNCEMWETTPTCLRAGLTYSLTLQLKVPKLRRFQQAAMDINRCLLFLPTLTWDV